MHSVELDKKLRLSDPAKVLEGAWELLKRTRQQLDTTLGEALSIADSAGQSIPEKKRARLDAGRQKGRGIPYLLRTTLR